jgi:hypothetical protein
MIRWRKVLVHGCAIALFGLAACAFPAVLKYREIQRWEAAQQPDPQPADAAQWAAIFKALMGSYHFRSHLPSLPPDASGKVSGQLRLPVRLVDTSLVLCEYDQSLAIDDPPCPVAAKGKWNINHAHFNDAIPAKLRRELVLANRTPSSVPAPIKSEFQLITRDEFDVLNEGGADAEDEWDSGVLQTTRPVLSQDGRYAAVYVEFPECCMWGGGYFYFLELGESGWKVNMPL